MSSVPNRGLVGVDEYLASEPDSPVKREYVGGLVYARPTESNRHKLIATNCLGRLGERLRGERCRAYNSDAKVRLRLPTHVRFYYPDGLIVGRSNSQDDTFHDEAVVVVEVVSERSRRVDEVEKKDGYLTIPSLFVYAIVEQATPSVAVFRRTEQGFVREFHAGLDAVIPLPEIDVELPLAEVYEDIEFSPAETT